MSIASQRQQGFGVRAIARAIDRSASTVSREPQRNTEQRKAYASARAQRMAQTRRQAGRPWPKLYREGKLWLVVKTCLSWRWSPGQIACTLVRMWPDEPDMQVSHETIYTRSTRTPAASCAASSSVACVRARAPADRGLRARTGAGRSPRCSTSTCSRPKWRTE
ncbi:MULTISPECIES: helix-turn-helix domain-containing protein [unclassified Rhizobacter]|uniref:helix-turn-helix domain-containing protein n=1 Tax=unclassified Rhizobacter TaxID=2640088 RepID=UPI001911150E|nr:MULTISPECIES: helix-turn-helix domain-containing protein [unclassified Rhizobacter]